MNMEKNYFETDSNLILRTKKGARFVHRIIDHSDFLTALHVDIGLWGFRAPYKIVADCQCTATSSISCGLAANVRRSGRMPGTSQRSVSQSRRSSPRAARIRRTAPVYGLRKSLPPRWGGASERLACRCRTAQRAQHRRRKRRSTSHPRPVWNPSEYPLRQLQAGHCRIHA